MRIRHVVAHQLGRCLAQTHINLSLRIRHVVTFDLPPRSQRSLVARRIAFRGLTFQFVIDNAHTE